MKIIGRRSCHGDERCEEEDKEETQIDDDDDDEEEEEALSLCDLPVKEKQQPTRSVSPTVVETDQDFDFNHWRPPPSPMLTADDLFFQGHMLPLRLSFSSENSQNNNGNLWSRSESMDRNNMLRFRNESTSSSSSRSHYSRSSSLSNNSISIPTNSKPRPSNNNVFHSHPSPTPQIRSFSTSSHRSRSSSRWEFFRLGLLRTPGMELHDLKTRTTTTTTTTAHKTTASILGVVSCKRSVETVPTTTGSKNRIRRENVLKNNKKNNDNNKVEIREKEKERRVSHRRTFEWLKQLSHATFGEEQ